MFNWGEKFIFSNQHMRIIVLIQARCCMCKMIKTINNMIIEYLSKKNAYIFLSTYKSFI